MITIAVPGGGTLRLQYLVLDVNGTLTVDGTLLPGVAGRISRLRTQIAVELLTADTRGRLEAIQRALQVTGTRLGETRGAEEKRLHVVRLGADRVVAIGNGMNDIGMLEAAALGIVVLGPEGAAGAALRAADVVTARITDALDLLLDPLRLIATLRR